MCLFFWQNLLDGIENGLVFLDGFAIGNTKVQSLNRLYRNTTIPTCT